MQKLVHKGYPAARIHEVLADFQQRGLQSDRRFAEAFVRARLARGYGRLRIEQELRQRGIDARAFVEPVAWAEAGEGLLERVHDRRYGDGVPQSPQERAARERYLLRRGFSRDDIGRLFRRLREGGTDD